MNTAINPLTAAEIVLVDALRLYRRPHDEPTQAATALIEAAEAFLTAHLGALVPEASRWFAAALGRGQHMRPEVRARVLEFALSLTGGPDLFELGRRRTTPGAADVLEAAGVSSWDLIRRHVSGDWAELGEHDLMVQQESLISGARMFSVYTVGGETVWVITEAVGDEGRRASTCVLLPSEY